MSTASATASEGGMVCVPVVGEVRTCCDGGVIGLTLGATGTVQSVALAVERVC